jgi:hypothetical protein
MLVSLNYKVFQEANTGDTCIFVFVINQIHSLNSPLKYAIIKRAQEIDKALYREKKQIEFKDNPRLEFYLSENVAILNKVFKRSVPLGTIAKCTMGIKPYQKRKGRPKQSAETVKKRVFDSMCFVKGRYPEKSSKIAHELAGTFA